MPWPRAFTLGFIPFLPGDLLKALVLFFLLQGPEKGPAGVLFPPGLGKCPLLEVRDLIHRFPPDLTVLRGNILLPREREFSPYWRGRNGSGKTVLIKHLNGLLKPTGGEVLFQGRSVWEEGPWARGKIGMVFQDPDSCILGQSVWEDTAFGLENLGFPQEEIVERIEATLLRLNLWEKREYPPRLLSGGEKKKLTIAGSLVMRPEILIIDEPFVGLDYPGVYGKFSPSSPSCTRRGRQYW